MKKTFLILLFPFIIFSQSKKFRYFDFNFDEISFLEYRTKKESKLFDIVMSENGNTLIKKLRPLEFYGKLNKIKKNQLTKLFNKRLKIDTSKIWYIHYLDFMPNFKNMPKVSGIEFLDSLNKPIGEFLSNQELKNKPKKTTHKRHRHVYSYKDYIKNIIKEKNKVSNDIEFLHFFTKNKEVPLKDLHKYNYFIDDNSLVKRVFSDGLKNYDVIIIYPSGDFYMTKHGDLKKQKRLLKERFYLRQKKKWKKKMEKLKYLF